MKKAIAIILVFAICLSVPALASDGNVYVMNLSGELNTDFVESIPLGAKEMPLIHSVNTFSMNLVKESSGRYSANGQIPLESGLEEYSVSGELLEMETSTGDDAIIGVMIGYSEPNHSKLYMTVHSIPNEGKTFVHVNETRAINSAQEIDTIYAYGNFFDGMNEIVDKYTESWNNANQFETSQDVSPLATRSSNDKYQGQDIVCKKTSNANYPVIALTATGPDSIEPNLVYYTRIKVNSNNTAARSYISAALAPGVIVGFSVSGSASMTIEEDEVEYDDLNPESKSRNVTIPLPVFNLITESFSIESISFSSMKVSATNEAVGTESYNKSHMNNRATWDFSKYNDISWTTGEDPAEAETGFGAYATFTYFGSNAYGATVAYDADLTYSYTTQFGVSQYVGSFGTSASFEYDLR